MRGRLVVMLGLAFLLFATGAIAAPFLYVADREPTAVSSCVAIVDLGGGSPTVKIPVPTPYGISITPDGTKAYTANWQNWTCYAIDLTTTPPTTKRIETVVSNAQHIAIAPDGTLGYLASVAGTGDILIINTATGTISGKYPLGLDFPIASIYYTTVSPDGRWLFAVDGGPEGYIYQVDLKYGVGIQQFGVGSYLTSAVVSPDGTRLYVSSSGTGVTHIYNLYADTLHWVGSIPGAYGLRMLLSKDGSRLYLANYWEGCLQIYDTNTNIIQTINGISTPVGLALTPDEKTLLVSSETGGYVAKIDLATNSITKLEGFVKPEEIAILAGPEVPEVLKVAIDIKPGSSVNPIQLKSKGKVPVAILGNPAFDVTTVDRRTVVFAEASPLSIGGLPEDVNGDGLLDLLLHFETQDLQLQPGDTQACLSGKTWSGQAFTGCDTVRIIELKAKKSHKQGKK